MWLRSQLSSVADLQIEIEGCDRNLLAGNIPKVSLTAQQAVYQGIHLSHINIVAHRIRVNLKQILKGKPLRLMEPIPIDLSIVVSASDLTQSRTAPLLQSAVQDLLQALLCSPRSNETKAVERSFEEAIQLDEIQLKNDGLILKVDIPSTPSSSNAILETSLAVGQPWELLFYDVHYHVESDPNFSDYPQTTSMNLGNQVKIRVLTLTPDSLICQSTIEVQP